MSALQRITWWRRVHARDDDAFGECPLGRRLLCPCCACPTLEEGSGEICPLCGWEDDGTDGAEHSPCNRTDLLSARTELEATGCVRAFGALAARDRDANLTLLATFDRLSVATDPAEIERLWRSLEQSSL